jgi:hypothetical protein
MSTKAQCDMTACDDDATHYVTIRARKPSGADPGIHRLELCRAHLDMAHALAESKLTKIVEYGPLNKAWTVHPGGIPK